MSPPTDELVRFVRDTLGCGCPEEVLERISVERSRSGEPGLDVGGRLLVRVVAGDDLDRLIDGFAATVERLRDERDLRGFNRVRLVVAHTRTDLVGEVLDGIVRVVAAGDDRFHVHVVPPEVIPGQLEGSSREQLPRPLP